MSPPFSFYVMMSLLTIPLILVFCIMGSLDLFIEGSVFEGKKFGFMGYYPYLEITYNPSPKYVWHIKNLLLCIMMSVIILFPVYRVFTSSNRRRR